MVHECFYIEEVRGCIPGSPGVCSGGGGGAAYSATRPPPPPDALLDRYAASWTAFVDVLSTGFFIEGHFHLCEETFAEYKMQELFEAVKYLKHKNK